MTNNELEGGDVEHYDGNDGSAGAVNDWRESVLKGQANPTVFAANGCDKALYKKRIIQITAPF